MSVGRFASAIVAGMLAGGLVAMSGVGRAHAIEPVVAPVVAHSAQGSQAVQPIAVTAPGMAESRARF